MLAYTCLRILSGLINQSTNGKNLILTSVCIHTYIYVYVYLCMYESIDKVEELILYIIFENKTEKQVIPRYLY